jgi:hypothetical protein
VEEIGGQDMGELHRVGGDGGVREGAASGGDNVLQAAADAATNLCRESGEEGLVVGHTRTNLTTGFRASPNSSIFKEFSLKTVPFWSIPLNADRLNNTTRFLFTNNLKVRTVI